MFRGSFFLLLTVMGAVALRTSVSAGEFRKGMEPLGILTQKGIVRVDDQAALPTTSLFPGDLVTTERDSVAVMKLGWGATVMLAANGEVSLPWEASTRNLNLRRGALVVRSGGPGPTEVSVYGARVAVGDRQGHPAVCRIAAVNGEAAIFADQGHVEVHGVGVPVLIPEGKWARLGAGMPPAGSQKAGAVSNAIPAETVQHQGETATQPLKANEDVQWEDLVRTLQTGRVRIQLLDGSALNVGARSVMRIIKHDPQTQQTQVELTLGRMRGEVVKLTKPGASFQVQTQTAVIGVVGTIFVVEALPNLTRVWCIEGVVVVRNINPAVAGEVTLHPGEYTTVPRGLPPSGATQASAAQIRNVMSQTNVPPTPVTAVSPRTLAVNGATLGATGASAVLAALALSRSSSAKNSLSQAQANASAALTAANSAAAAANNALNAATNAVVITQNVLQAVSPISPSCGCQ